MFTHSFPSMIDRAWRVTIVLAITVAACGKSTKDRGTAEPKVTDMVEAMTGRLLPG